MKQLVICLGVLMLFGVSSLTAGQESVSSTTVPPAPVKDSSDVSPAPARGLSRVRSGKPRGAAPAPLNAPGVIPQTPFSVNGRPMRATPPTNEEVVHAEAEIADAFRYKGTTAVPDKSLDAAQPQVKAVCELLSRSDLIPEVRARSFSAFLRPQVTVVGWHLTLVKQEVREHDSLVRVRVAPLLRAPGEGKLGMFVTYHENYRIADGNLLFLGADPEKPSGMGGGQ